MMVDPRQALATLARRREAKRQAAEARAARLRAAVPAAVAMLRAQHGVGRAWLFGSLAWGGPRLTSDVDLAVEGLPAERYFQALADLEGLLRGGVDLVRMEDADETLRARILAEGIAA